MCTERQIDRRTDMTKLIVAFRNFAKASKNKYACCCQNIPDAIGGNFSESGTVNDLLVAVHTPRHQLGKYANAIDADRQPMSLRSIVVHSTHRILVFELISWVQINIRVLLLLQVMNYSISSFKFR